MKKRYIGTGILSILGLVFMFFKHKPKQKHLPTNWDWSTYHKKEK